MQEFFSGVAEQAGDTLLPLHSRRAIRPVEQQYIHPGETVAQVHQTASGCCQSILQSMYNSLWSVRRV